MQTTNLNELAKAVHQAHIKWWQDVNTGEPIKRSPRALLMLVVTEIAEACEGVRKDLMDDKLPHRKMEEVEMADAYIRLLDFAGGFNYGLEDVDRRFVSSDKSEAMFHIVRQIIKCDGSSFAISETLGAIRDYCDQFGLDLIKSVEEKLDYNSKRIDHTHEHRRSEHGKRF